MHPQIQFTSWYSLVAIWQLQNNQWTLLQVARLSAAISMCRQHNSDECWLLVFPPQFDPTECHRRIHPARDTSFLPQTRRLQRLLQHQ